MLQPSQRHEELERLQLRDVGDGLWILVMFVGGVKDSQFEILIVAAGFLREQALVLEHLGFDAGFGGSSIRLITINFLTDHYCEDCKIMLYISYHLK